MSRFSSVLPVVGRDAPFDTRAGQRRVLGHSRGAFKTRKNTVFFVVQWLRNTRKHWVFGGCEGPRFSQTGRRGAQGKTGRLFLYVSHQRFSPKMQQARKKRGRPEGPLKALAKSLGISERTLRGWRLQGCPTDSLQAAERWRDVNISKPTSGHRPNESQPEDIAEARLRLVQKQAAREEQLALKYELENAVRRGELIERAEVERDLGLLCSRLNARFLSFGQSAAMVVPGELKNSVKAQIDEQVRLALKEFTEGLKSC